MAELLPMSRNSQSFVIRLGDPCVGNGSPSERNLGVVRQKKMSQPVVQIADCIDRESRRPNHLPPKYVNNRASRRNRCQHCSVHDEWT